MKKIRRRNEKQNLMYYKDVLQGQERMLVEILRLFISLLCILIFRALFYKWRV